MMLLKDDVIDDGLVDDIERIATLEQKVFPFQVLVSSTKDFHPTHKLGEGGFGPVFKGRLPDGRDVAVKKLAQGSRQGKNEFVNEAKLLAKVQHRNVVNLWGYCTHGDDRLLVYEYVANESLDKVLFKSNKRSEIEWKLRFEIITGIARGLLYLHEDAPNCIIHRDIKAGNILLDEKWVPKIADFGMARLYQEDVTHVNTRVAGTNGYMAPEYVMHGALSVKADVFSFGVVVLELISGQKNSCFSMRHPDQTLLEWAYRLYKKGRTMEILDPEIVASADLDQVKLCVQIGLLCVQGDPHERPAMRRVSLLLSRKQGNLEEPDRPGVPGSRYRRRSHHPSGASSVGTLSTTGSRTDSFGSNLNTDTGTNTRTGRNTPASSRTPTHAARSAAHGGGERCSHEDCTHSARGRSGLCVRHGGGKKCERENCVKSAQGSTMFCKAGGRRCSHEDCTRFAGGKSGLCIMHDGGNGCERAQGSSGSIIGNDSGILIFSCNDNDADETLFIEAILKGLHEREVTPLKYNLSGRESLDTEMLYNSSVGIMVLSDSFSHSGQFLDHLVAIMEHWKANHFVIIPVYFKVSPSDMCRLEDLFEAVQLQDLNSIQKWKEAMTELASINGHQWTEGTQFILAEEVGRDAWLYLRNRKNVVRILALLKHSQIVGIWGMAGIGKTFIAREIFEILAPQYDLCYFDVMGQREELRQMRDDFFATVFGGEKLSIGASDVKPSFMRDLFLNKKILIVLDDVSNARDVAYVVGGFDWFSRGHRIILTSRRKQVLIQCKVKEPYEIKLCEYESLRLCKEFLNGEQSGIIPELMSCSSGIPLALEVLGSSVSKQPTRNMKEHLQSLRINPPDEIREAFQRSFDGLDENEKNIFLDLACFFRGENMDHVVELLDACGFLTYLGICNLIDESLISLLDDKIEIPVPFQDMGRFIVHEEDENPWERSRLWDSNNIADVLTKNSGTEAIEGIFLDASDLNLHLSPIVFSNMHGLRFLKLHCSNSGDECKLSLPQGLDTLPDELRLLHWENYPLKCLPQKFSPENLVEVNMPYSKLEKLWEGKKNLEKLKKIKLSHSRELTDILMLSEALNIEHIDLKGCSSIVDVSTSIPRCGKLLSLNMKNCSHLRSVPAMSYFTSLKLLNMSGCSELEEIQDFAPNLKELYLAGTAIRELPLSIKNLNELVTLDLENCGRLQQLPDEVRNSRSIVELKLAGCRSLEGRKRKR